MSHYCSSSPRYYTSIRAGTRLYALHLSTRSIPCLTKLHSLFYPNGIKIIPQNIFELLSPIALAHLIMGDGSVKKYGLILCTNSYSIQDVVLLMNVLIIRYILDNILCLHSLILFFLTCIPLCYINSNLRFRQPSKPSQQIEVFDLKENTTTSYNSMSETARALNINQARIVMYFSCNQQKPYKGRYTFKKVD